jgi:hypothetical protein
LLVSALDGDREALEALAADPAGAELAKLHRVGPALALRARRLGIEGPSVASWRRALLGMTAHRLRIEERLAALGTTLGTASIAWLPIKGCDLGSRVYERPEERPVGDVDILIAEADYLRARAALEAAGWRSLVPGARVDAYLLEEGYAWQATDPSGLLLEVHHRLWGLVPAGFPAALLAASEPDPALGATARRLPLAHAWLLAAVHIWLNPPPRPLLAVWDLERIAAAEPPARPHPPSPSPIALPPTGRGGATTQDPTTQDTVAADVSAFGRGCPLSRGMGERWERGTGGEVLDAAVRLAMEWDLGLPAALAAAYAAGLWTSEPNRRIAGRLMSTLRPAESLTARRALESGVENASLESIVLARLLSFRSSRAGWRSLPRRIWAHPGIVEMETPTGRSWPARRLAHVLKSFGG